MMGRLSELATRRRRVVLVVALLLALIGGTASTSLFGKLSAGGFADPGAESGQAADLVEERFGQSPPNLALLVAADDGVDDPAAAAAGAGLAEQLAGEPYLRDVVSYWTAGQAPQLRNEDGDKALVLATITGDENEVNERVGELADTYGGTLADGVDVQVGGYAAFSHELTEQSEKDVITGELIVFPVTLVALVLVFGGVLAALLPLAVAAVTSLLGMGMLWMLAEVTDLSVFAANVVTLAGLGLAIDYSLLMVNRYREELAAGREVRDAIRATMTSAGRTVLFASLTVCISLATLTMFPLPAIRSIGYAGVVTALLAAAASLLVLPALFAVLGRRVGATRFRRRRREGSAEDGFWHRLAMFVMRRPLPIATVVTALLLLLGTPFLGMKLGYLDERVMPDSSQARQVASTIRAEFTSGEQDALQVVAPSGADAGTDVVGDYAASLSALEHVSRVDTVTGSYVDGTHAAPAAAQHQAFAADGSVYLSVVPDPGTTDRTQDLVADVRGLDAPFETLVGGTAAMAEDADAALLDRLPLALGAVGLAMVVLLFLLTGSVLLPFLALVLTTLSLTATFGAMVWIFQDGNLADLFGFTVTGFTISTVPVMLFALAFGLAMDYQVFMLSRIREEYERGASPTAAVALGLERVGRIVTAAAVLISLVFLAFLVSDITLMKAFGVGLPLAVLIDATLIRGALLPATMRLAGRATWWAPAPLRRLHARIGLRESSPEGERELVSR